MANTSIQLKKSGITGNVPTSLSHGELAINYADGKLFYRNSNNEITYISSGATSNSFATINANSSLILATSSTDTLSIKPGNNITISADTGGKSITLGVQPTDTLTSKDSSLVASANAVNAVYDYAQSAYAYANTLSGSSSVFVQSNVVNLISGSDLIFNVSYDNISYPGGVFTLEQQGPVSLIVTDIWQGGTSNKNAYLDYTTNTINTKNVSITLASSNATFNVQTTDTINIGSSTITGSNLLSLGITSTGGTYIIPSDFFAPAIQTNSSSAVVVKLTTSRSQITSNGNTLTNTQPVPFNITTLTGSWPSSSVPYWSLNQTFNWSAVVVGTVSSGNVTYSGASSGSLTTVGATSGSSGSLDSTLSYSISSSDYRGAGNFGAGTRTIPSTVSSSITPATKYYPIFYKTTSSSSNPNITTSDSHNSNTYVLGQGTNTTATESDYTWIAIPGSSSHTFAFTFLNTPVVVTPSATYTSQTISGQTYNVYGFTNFSAVTFIYTTS